MQYFLAVGIPFVVLMLFGPVLINILKHLNFSQQIRGQGPETHHTKKGIPTMGGILIILGILLTTTLLLKPENNILILLGVTTSMGVIGFLDDFLKIKSGQSLGLRAREKILFQVIIGLLLAHYVNKNIGSGIIVPGRGIIELEWWIIPLVIVTVLGTVNAVNLTDGLDGLAAGVTAVVTSAFAVILSALTINNLTLFALIVTGACLGFIWFNSHPAQVFMGDVGSLALGGAVAGIAVLSRTELFLLIIGGVYVLETLSVIIQVIYFQLTGGKRVFRMTPLHHHYELKGLTESKIVARFLLISIVFAVLGLIAFYSI